MSVRTAVDGDFSPNVGSTETSFEAFLSAMGMENEVPEFPEDSRSVENESLLKSFLDGEEEAEEEFTGEEEYVPNSEEFEEDDDYAVDNDEDESEEEEEEEDTSDASDDDDDEEDEEDVDFGDLEIDMDSEIQIGEEYVTVNDLIKNRLSREELEYRTREIETKAEDLNEKEVGLVETLERAVLECDKVIEDYKTFDWKKLASEDPASYAQHREFLEAYLARKGEIEQDYVKAKQKEVEAEKEIKHAAAIEAVKVLKQEITGWNETLYGQLMDYAINELGMAEDFVTSSTDVGLFKTVHGIMKRDKDLKVAVTKVRRPSVRKASKASSPKNAVKKSAPRRASSKPSEVGIASYDVASYNHFTKLGIK